MHLMGQSGISYRLFYWPMHSTLWSCTARALLGPFHGTAPRKEGLRNAPRRRPSKTQGRAEGENGRGDTGIQCVCVCVCVLVPELYSLVIPETRLVALMVNKTRGRQMISLFTSLVCSSSFFLSLLCPYMCLAYMISYTSPRVMRTVMMVLYQVQTRAVLPGG